GARANTCSGRKIEFDSGDVTAVNLGTARLPVRTRIQHHHELIVRIAGDLAFDDTSVFQIYCISTGGLGPHPHPQAEHCNDLAHGNPPRSQNLPPGIITDHFLRGNALQEGSLGNPTGDGKSKAGVITPACRGPAATNSTSCSAEFQV